MAQHVSQTIEIRPLASDRSVKWLPLDDGFYLLASVMTSTRAAPLYVMQQALLQVESHQAVSGGELACGILCGSPCVDPATGAEYILVQDTEHVAQSATDADSDAALAADLSNAIARVERMGRRVIGWYRCDVPLGQLISMRNVGLHRSLFPEPWQVALFRDGVMGQGRGALMRVEPNEGRAFSIPFVEISAHRRHHGTAPLLSSVHWLNYRSETEVALLPDEAFLGGYRPPVEEPVQQEQRRPGLLAGLFGRRAVSIAPQRTTPTAVVRPVPFEPQPLQTTRWPRSIDIPHPTIPAASRTEYPAVRPIAPAPVTPAPVRPAPIAPAPIARAPESSAPPPVAAAPIASAPSAQEPSPPPPTASEPPAREFSSRQDAETDKSPAPKATAPKASSRRATRNTPARGVNSGRTMTPSQSRDRNEDATEPPPAPSTAKADQSFAPLAGTAQKPIFPAKGSDWPERSVPVFDEGTEPERAVAMDELLAELRRRVRIEPDRDQLAASQLRQPRGSMIRRALAVAAILIVGFLALQGLGALRAGKGSAANGELDPHLFRQTGTPTNAAAEAPAPAGALSPDQLAQARSALARMGTAADSLQAQLAALDTALAQTPGASSRSAMCASATSLYEKSLADSVLIGTAQHQLTQLMGPAPMDRVDGLFQLLSRARPQLRAACG